MTEIITNTIIDTDTDVDRKLSTGEFCKIIVDKETKDLTNYGIRNFVDNEGKINLVIIDKTKKEASIWKITRSPFSPTGFSVIRSTVKAHCSGAKILKP